MYMDKKKDASKDNVGAFFQTCKVKGSNMRCVIARGIPILTYPVRELIGFVLMESLEQPLSVLGVGEGEDN